jgi:hypothetical protein
MLLLSLSLVVVVVVVVVVVLLLCFIFVLFRFFCDRLCGLVARVPGYRYGGPGFDSRALQKKSSGSGTGSTQPREYN